jgi:branched-chain amino acid transport system substrate-binding protein
MRLALSKAIAGCLAIVSVAALSACGGSGNSSSSGGAEATGPASKTVAIYSSLPMRGPAEAETVPLVKGIRLALSQAGGQAGRFMVTYQSLDDSAGSGGWDASQTAANARKAAADPRTVYYIGEFDDAASEVSMPILNEAGIPQVSPANTYVTLTTGAPANDWPTGTRTYLRIVPTDSVQAAADLLAMRQAGCTKVAVASDEEAYGNGLAKLIAVQKGYYGTDVVSDAGINPGERSFHSYALMLRDVRADCLLVAGVASKGIVELTKEVHAELPAAKIFGPADMCTSAWTNYKDGGVPATVDPLIECTKVTQSLAAYPGGKAFLAAYKAKYPGSNPNPYALLGYEAMKLGLSTIAGLGAKGDSKLAVLSALFATADRHSVLGTYGFDKVGDTTLKSIGLYRVGASGNPTFVKTITPAHVL